MNRRRAYTIAATAVLVLCARPAAAQAAAEERERREAEIFGGTSADESDEPEEEAPAAPSDDHDDAPASPLQEFSPDDVAGSDVLRELDRVLDVGGRAYLALQYTLYEEGEPLFPPLSSPSLLDLYADARPSPRVRAYVQARLDYDFTADDDGARFEDLEGVSSTTALPFARRRQALLLDQLWLKLDVARLAYLTLGKQRIRWGTGRFWNPTDFLNRRARDPLDVFDRRLGVSLVRASFPLERLGSNLYLIGDLEEVSRLDDAGLAARAEAVFGTTEISTTAAVRRGEPLRFGADVSSGVWLFDLRAEGAAVFNSTQPFFVGDVDLERGVLPTEISRADEWIFQVVLGGELALPYSATDSVTVGGEYFYNDAGYDDVDLYPVLLARQAFLPLYVGRHYAAAYAVLAQPGRLDDTNVIVSTIGNLSDQSFLTRVDVATLFLTFFTVNVWGAVHYGNEGELRLALDLPPLPGVPGAEGGLSVPAPIVDVGAAITLDF